MKKGISLVALVITIIVLIILTGTIILTATNTNIFGKSEEAVFKNNVAAFQEELTKKILEEKLKDPTFSESTINASTSADIAQWIPSIAGTGYEDSFEIVGGKLIFKGTDTKQIEYVEKLGITVSETNTSSGGNNPGNTVIDEDLEKYILGPNKTGRSLEEIINMETGVFINEASTIPNASETVHLVYGDETPAIILYDNVYYEVAFNSSYSTTGLNVANITTTSWAARGLTSSNVVFNQPYNCYGEYSQSFAYDSITLYSDGSVDIDGDRMPGFVIDSMIQEGQMVFGENFYYMPIIPDETGTVDYYMLFEFDGAGTATVYYCEAEDISGTPTRDAIKENNKSGVFKNKNRNYSVSN